jgi:hypothetical protein
MDVSDLENKGVLRKKISARFSAVTMERKGQDGGR